MEAHRLGLRWHPARLPVKHARRHHSAQHLIRPLMGPIRRTIASGRLSMAPDSLHRYRRVRGGSDACRPHKGDSWSRDKPRRELIRARNLRFRRSISGCPIAPQMAGRRRSPLRMGPLRIGPLRMGPLWMGPLRMELSRLRTVQQAPTIGESIWPPQPGRWKPKFRVRRRPKRTSSDMPVCGCSTPWQADAATPSCRSLRSATHRPGKAARRKTKPFESSGQNRHTLWQRGSMSSGHPTP